MKWYTFNNCAYCHQSANEHDIRVDGNSKNELRRDELNNAKKFIKSKEKYIKKKNEEKREHDVD